MIRVRGGAWLLLVAACGGASPTPPPATGAVAPAKRGEPSAREMKLDLVQVERGVRVRVEATGSAGDVHAWQLGADLASRIDVLDANDRPLAFRRQGQRLEITASATTVVLRYEILAKPGAPPAGDEDARSTMIDEQRFRGVGDKILALPEAFEKVAVPIAFTQSSLPTGRIAASSFGTGRDHVTQRLELPGRSLRRSVFLFGPGGRAELDAPEGHDESAWLGYTAFDSRSVSAEVAGFRGVLHEYFKDIELAPATLFFSVDARPRGGYRVARAHSGVLVVLSGLDPFDAGLRLAVAHELVHAWIGERTWVGDATPGKEIESLWFQEGVARWVAREQLAPSGCSPSTSTPRSSIACSRSSPRLAMPCAPTPSSWSTRRPRAWSRSSSRAARCSRPPSTRGSASDRTARARSTTSYARSPGSPTRRTRRCPRRRSSRSSATRSTRRRCARISTTT